MAKRVSAYKRRLQERQKRKDELLERGMVLQECYATDFTWYLRNVMDHRELVMYLSDRETDGGPFRCDVAVIREMQHYPSVKDFYHAALEDLVTFGVPPDVINTDDDLLTKFANAVKHLPKPYFAGIVPGTGTFVIAKFNDTDF